MDIASLHRPSPAASIPIEHLDRNARLSEADKVAEATRQFEAVLLRQILTAARKQVHLTGDDTPPSAADEMYQDMINTQLADAISRSGDFGLARSLQVQFQARGTTDGPT